jgi:CheY-like chemotaxis protein
LKKTLLLADDSPTIQKVINLTFADEGIDVIAVSDGNAAIQQLREMTPDLVMADVHMPGLNGYQICERLRQNAELKNVPVILLVGSFEPFDEEEAKRVGADDFLMKPFQSIRQLVSRVGALLEPPQPEAGQTEAPAIESAASEPEIAETPEAETAEIVETTETARELAPVVGEYSDLGDELMAETAPGETVATGLSSQEVFDEEDDDLLNFDKEFDKKFPDAASLSSEQIDSVGFAQPEQDYAPEQNYSDEEAPAEPVQYDEVVPFVEESYEASPAEPVPHQDGVPFAEERYEAPPAQPAQHEEKISFVEEENYVEAPVETPAQTAQPGEISFAEETADVPAFPEDDLNRIIALQQPERVTDEVEEKSIELVVPEASESSSILDLGNLGRFGAPREYGTHEERRESDALLDIDTGEAGEERYVTPVTEAVDEIVAETTGEVSGETTFDETTSAETISGAETIPGETKYDFRSPDAFDEDADIEESFHGLSGIEEQPVPVFEAPLERVVDEEAKPGNVSEDQADGFSGLTVPPVAAEVPPEAIDAAAQKVFEQISEKVVTEMVRGLMPQIRDLVAREIAKEKE